MKRRSLRLPVLLAGSLMATQLHAAQVLFYDFNDASNPALAKDTSGKGNNGEVFDATFTPDAGGRSGKAGDRAMDFGDFNNDAYINVPNAGSGAFDSVTANDAVTLSMWIFGGEEQPADQWTFYAGPYRQLGSHTPWSNGNVYFDVAGTEDSACCNDRINVGVPLDTFAGAWNHYAFVKDGDTTAIWQNGSKIVEGGDMRPLNEITEFFIGVGPEGDRRSYNGLIDDFGVWDSALSENEILGLAAGRPPLEIGGAGAIGALTLSSTLANKQFGPGQQGAGLAHEWFQSGNPGSKAGVDNLFNSMEPAVPAFRSGAGTSWWSGSDAPFGPVPQYPEETAGPFNDTNNDAYSVRLTGEILIPESGNYKFTDGVDDYTYLAIDTNKSGIAGDVPEEVLIDDNDWTNVFREGNNAGQGKGYAEATINVGAGGEWLDIEFDMSEGGGGDSGVLYWDYDGSKPAGQRVGGAAGYPSDELTPIDPADAESLLIPDSNLRSTIAPLVKADRVGQIPVATGGFAFEVNGTNDTADKMEIPNTNPAVYTTKLDVTGVPFHIRGTGTLNPGDSFQIIDVNSITGTPTIIADVAGQSWTFNAATGRITFGAGLAGDYSGNGVLDAADLDMQATAIGNNGPAGTYDLTGDGAVNYDDRLAWINTIKKTWIGDADLDGQFNSSDFVTVFQAGKFETGGAATWTEGDWDGNKLFNTSDFVAAFQQGGYEAGPKAAVSAVPEPSSMVLLALGGLGLIRVRRRRS